MRVEERGREGGRRQWREGEGERKKVREKKQRKKERKKYILQPTFLFCCRFSPFLNIFGTKAGLLRLKGKAVGLEANQGQFVI